MLEPAVLELEDELLLDVEVELDELELLELEPLVFPERESVR